jgi:hypothetical protein
MTISRFKKKTLITSFIGDESQYFKTLAVPNVTLAVPNVTLAVSYVTLAVPKVTLLFIM